MPEKRVMKIIKKKKANFPESLIDEIAAASERRDLTDKELE